MTHTARNRQREDIAHLVERLIAEYAGAVPAGAVMRCVSRVRHELLQAGVRTNLVATVEQVARARLSARIPAHGAA